MLMTDEVKYMPKAERKRFAFEVLSTNFVHGNEGDEISMELTSDQAEALLRSGAVKLAETRPTVASTRKKG